MLQARVLAGVDAAAHHVYPFRMMSKSDDFDFWQIQAQWEANITEPYYCQRLFLLQ